MKFKNLVMGFTVVLGLAACGSDDTEYSAAASDVIASEEEVALPREESELPSGEAQQEQPRPSSAMTWKYVGTNASTCISISDSVALGINYTPVIGSNCTPVSAIHGGFAYDIRQCQPAGGTGRNCAGGNTGKLHCLSLPTYICY